MGFLLANLVQMATGVEIQHLEARPSISNCGSGLLTQLLWLRVNKAKALAPMASAFSMAFPTLPLALT